LSSDRRSCRDGCAEISGRASPARLHHAIVSRVRTKSTARRSPDRVLSAPHPLRQILLYCPGMGSEESKYTRVEYERRFLVSPQGDWRRSVEPYSKIFQDRYLRPGRLRLRILTDSDTGRRLIKLTKKFESDSPYFQRIGRILLSPGEHELFAVLPGDQLQKTRYYHHHQGRVFSIDVFEGELDGLILCETEADGLEELLSIRPPAYARHEVTEDTFFTGGNLCRSSRVDLLRKLSTFA
jgi:CYTH domain-containing protein